MPYGSTDENSGESPSNKFYAVTPSDTTLVDARAIFVGGEGNLVLENEDGTDVTFAVKAGTLLPVSPKRVKAATTATGIVAL